VQVMASYIHVRRQTALEQLVLGVAILLTPLGALFQDIVENGKLADEDYNTRFVESRRHGEELQYCGSNSRGAL